MKHLILKSWLMLLMLLVGVGTGWAEDVTYTWTYSSSKFTVSSSGTVPAGSSASLTSTYSSANQLTGGKTQTFTLAGYDDCIITGVSINLKRTSSTSAKANITISANGEQIGSATNLTLTTSQEDYPITVTSTKVGAGKTVVITVNAAANSIYVYNYKITYETTSKTATTTTFGNEVDGQNFDVTQGDAPFTKTATLSPVEAGSITYSSSNTAVADVNSSTGEVTIGVPGKATIQAAFAGNENYSKSSAEYTVTVAPKGTPVTYAITSTTEVSTDGTTPDGSAATYSQTYGTKGQMTGSNSATLTLSGYAGCKINSIKLNMKSNGTSGAGTFSAVAGTTTLASIATATTFDKWFDNTEYSTSYKDILVTMDNTSYVIGDEEKLVINIAATANSLYINSYTIYYEIAQPAAATPVITPADGTEFSTATKEVSISAADGATIYYTLDGSTPDDTKTLYEGAFNISATTTVKAIAYETDKRPSAVASATITYVAPVTTFDINCNAPVGGSYTVKVGNEEAQTVTAAIVIAGGEGKTITLTSTPSAGYKLASTPFTVKDADEATISVSKDGDSYTFTMPSKAVTVTANYSAVYSITAADGIVGGTISFTDKDDKVITETSQGSKVNVVVTPATGYELATLTYNKDGEEPTDIKENKYFTMPGGAVTVTATFSKINYTITYAEDLTGGSVSGVATANYGDEVTLTATPADGYAFGEWNVTSGENPLTVTENKITMPAANVNVSASFRQLATVTLSENGSETTLAGTHYVGDEVTLPSSTTAAVPEGKTFMGWSEAPIATTNDKPSYLAKGATYTITGETKTFYAVYATEVESTYDVVFNVANEADDREWANAVAYTNVTKSPLTFTVTGGGNNGKYYTSDETWRMYSGGAMKISATTGTTINSVTTDVTSSFSKNKDGSYSCSYSGTVKYTSLTINVTGTSIGHYETSVQQKTLASISVTGTPEEFWKGEEFNHNGMTVTASYEEQGVEDEDVTAFAQFSTPDMSTAGQKTVTVTYQGKTATYNIEVLTIANTAETAYTTEQAIELIDAGKDLDTEVYVTGVVSKVDKYNESYKSITYWLDDDAFEIYGGLAKEGEEFSSINDIEVGATVVVLGKIKKYNDTYEADLNNRLVSYKSPYTINTEDGTAKVTGIVTSSEKVMNSIGKDINNVNSIDMTAASVSDEVLAEISAAVEGKNIFVYAPSTSSSQDVNVVVNGTCENMVLTDKIPVNIPDEIIASNITYQRMNGVDVEKLVAGKYATVYLPYAFSIGDFKVMKYVGVVDGVVNFKYVTETEANVPYVIRPNDVDEASLSFGIEDDVVSVQTASSSTSSTGFYGTYEVRTLHGTDGYYGFASGEFKKANDAGTIIRPFRAYMYVSPYGARPSSFGFSEDATTGLNDIFGAFDRNEPMYDMNGNRVTIPARGQIVIMGGKKVMVK